MDLDCENGIKLIIKAAEEQSEERLFRRWTTNYEKEMSFDEFKSKLNQTVRNKGRIDKTLTQEEIMDDVEGILNQFRR